MNKQYLKTGGFLWVTILLLSGTSVSLFAQDHAVTGVYFQQEVHYRIAVALDDDNHTLTGDETLVYVNHSPDTLTYIWFHLWPNAYKDNTTALYKQLATLNERKDKLMRIRENGYIDHLDFTVDGQRIETEPHPAYIDIIKLRLRNKLPPGGRITIATPFFVKIPSYFSRLGHEGHSYMITQWYPKPAVYDRSGWHEFPYLDQGEFYSEFGSFDVRITLPTHYVVGATGTLMTADELEQYKRIGRHNLSVSFAPGHNGSSAPSSPPQYYKAAGTLPAKTLEYHAENVHDFAWFADPHFIINYDTLRLPSGRIIDIFSYYRAAPNTAWSQSIAFIKDAVLHYGGWIGEYDYPVASALEGPGNVSSGGMEYPMITLITSPGAGKEELDGVIAHEVGHNWFYGMLGSNERDHAWMDEGINTYYESRYEAEKYRGNPIITSSEIPNDIRKQPTDAFLDAMYTMIEEVVGGMKLPEAIDTKAPDFPSEFDYSLVEYTATALWMHKLEKAMGKADFDKGMQQYFADWKFKHPGPGDLKTSLEKVTNLRLDKYFDMLYKRSSF